MSKYHRRHQGYVDDDEGRRERKRRKGREWQPIGDGMGVETGPPGAGATITQSALPR